MYIPMCMDAAQVPDPGAGKSIGTMLLGSLEAEHPGIMCVP